MSEWTGKKSYPPTQHYSKLRNAGMLRGGERVFFFFFFFFFFWGAGSGEGEEKKNLN
jgi:hypothetical protein